MNETTIKALHSADEVIARNQRTIEALREMQPLMKEMGDHLERFADDYKDLPVSPFAGMNHGRATGRGV